MPHDSFDEIVDLVDIFYNSNKRLVVNKLTPPSVIEEVRNRLLETVSGLDIMLKQTDEMRLRPNIRHLVDARRTLAVSGAMRWRWSSEAPLGNLNDRNGDNAKYKTDTYKEGFCF